MTSRPIEHLSEIAAAGTPAYVVDPKTQAAFVLLSAEQFDKVRAMLSDEQFEISEAYPLMDEVARSEGWDDPEMDVYDQKMAGRNMLNADPFERGRRNPFFCQ